ncbi:MAG: alkaline phosphatase family protein, partial [Actinomycetota bacterium]
LDEGLERLLERTTERDLIIFMSDHGHQACTRCVTMDRVLKHLGFLEFGRGSFAFNLIRWGPGRRIARRLYDIFKLHGKVSIPASPIEWSKTKAYTSVRSTGEGISINLAGREPHGVVDPGDFDRVRSEVAERVAGFVDPATGRRPVGRISFREEVFKGRYADDAPDLLLEPAPLYSLTHAKSMVEPADWLSGDHRIEGVLAAAGPHVDAEGFRDRSFNLVDLAPTILAGVGATPSVRHSGQVLPALVGTDVAVATGNADRTPVRTEGQPGSGLDDAEAEEVEEHLRGLGYLE